MLPDGLLRAILDGPGDDFARLVAADWLEEHGEPGYGEFIRLQIELDRHFDPHEHAPRADHLRRRERELLAAHEARWVLAAYPAGTVHPRPECWGWRRGFIASVTLPTADFLRHAAALFRAWPVEAVTLSDRRPTHHIRPDGPGYWRWYDGTPYVRRGAADPDELPPGLWPVYDRVTDEGGVTWEHPTREDAFLWLSRACVAFGRAAAGLP